MSGVHSDVMFVYSSPDQPLTKVKCRSVRSFPFLGEGTISELLEMRHLIPAVKQGLMDYSAG